MKTFTSILNAFPAVLNAVQAVETAIPLPAAGQQKLNLVLNAAATAREVGQIEQQLSKNFTVSSVASMVTVAVACLNAAGVFKKTAPVSSN
jgi:hypothetical protein